MKKDILINAAGIGVGQIVVLAATPLLSRIYSPAEFGSYAALVAACGSVGTIGSLRFDAALPAVPDENVIPLLQVALLLPVLVSISAVLAFEMFSASMGGMANFVAAHSALVISISILLGATNVCQAYFVRKGDFKQVAAMKIVQPVTHTLVALAAIAGLSGAYFVSWFVVLLIALWGCRSALLPANLERSWQAVKDARKYPFMSAPVALLDTVSLALPVFFIVANYGNESAGNYSQVQRLLSSPLLLLGVAASQVFYKYAGELHRNGASVEPLMWRVVIALSGLSLLLLVITIFFGEWLMGLVLGAGWRTDLQFLLLACLPVLFRMVVSPISSVFMITNKIGLGSTWQITYFVVTVGVIMFARNRLDLEGYLLALAGAELVMYIFYLALAIWAIRIGRADHHARVY